jgi:hypothetical protein
VEATLKNTRNRAYLVFTRTKKFYEEGKRSFREEIPKEHEKKVENPKSKKRASFQVFS